MPELKKAKKKADLLQIDKVPLYDANKQVIGEYLHDLYGYCVLLHNEVKDFGFSKEDAKDFFMYMCKNSNEPQYVILRRITIAQSFLKEEGDSHSADTISEVFSELERLKTYVNSLKQLTYRDLQIRAIAEHYYMNGLSVKEVVKTLMSTKTKILLEYDEEDVDLVYEKTNANTKRIERYFKSFKNYDVQKFDS